MSQRQTRLDSAPAQRVGRGRPPCLQKLQLQRSPMMGTSTSPASFASSTCSPHLIQRQSPQNCPRVAYPQQDVCLQTVFACTDGTWRSSLVVILLLLRRNYTKSVQVLVEVLALVGEGVSLRCTPFPEIPIGCSRRAGGAILRDLT